MDWCARSTCTLVARLSVAHAFAALLISAFAPSRFALACLCHLHPSRLTALGMPPPGAPQPHRCQPTRGVSSLVERLSAKSWHGSGSWAKAVCCCCNGRTCPRLAPGRARLAPSRARLAPGRASGAEAAGVGPPSCLARAPCPIQQAIPCFPCNALGGTGSRMDCGHRPAHHAAGAAPLWAVSTTHASTSSNGLPADRPSFPVVALLLPLGSACPPGRHSPAAADCRCQLAPGSSLPAPGPPATSQRLRQLPGQPQPARRCV